MKRQGPYCKTAGLLLPLIGGANRAMAACPHARDGAPAVFRRRGAARKTQLDVLEVAAASVSSGRAPMRRIEAGPTASLARLGAGGGPALLRRCWHGCRARRGRRRRLLAQNGGTGGSCAERGQDDGGAACTARRQRKAAPGGASAQAGRAHRWRCLYRGAGAGDRAVPGSDAERQRRRDAPGLRRVQVRHEVGGGARWACAGLERARAGRAGAGAGPR
jgi:hypothetical protein